MKVLVKVPATTANLGPGFDALGLALNLWNETEFTQTNNNKIVVTVNGEGQENLPTNADNTIAQTALQIYKLANKSCPGLRIDCLNRIPLGSGLGSSSAAILTGMLGANTLLGNPFTDEEILQLSIKAEGHPDNVAPAMLGGLVVSSMDADRAISVKIPADLKQQPIHITIVLPDFELSTQKARAALPKQVAYKDAVYNLSRVVLVTEAFRTGDLKLLGLAMQDRLHQPYRLPLIPGAIEALAAGKKSGAAAVALSGAGPSLIAFSPRQDTGIGASMKQEFESAGVSSRAFELEPNYDGAKVNIILPHHLSF